MRRIVEMLTSLLMVLVWPKNLTTNLAGVSVAQREPFQVAYRDPSSGYFAYKTVDCDGAHRSVTLTKDRRIVGDAGYDTGRFGRKASYDNGQKILEKRLALMAGNGVALGSSPSKMTRDLGRPHRVSRAGKRGEYWCAMYKSVLMETKDEGQVLRNSYIFKNGRLIEISLHLDSIPGCGGDSLSDEGWPWTVF